MMVWNRDEDEFKKLLFIVIHNLPEFDKSQIYNFPETNG